MNWEKSLIDYRREKATETLEVAKILLERKHYFSAVNRIYYAMFYEVSALLQTENLSAHKHSGTISLFNQHFIKTGIIDVGIGKFYSEMFGFRQEGDYDDFIYFEEDEVNAWFQKAEKYIKILDEFIEKRGCDESNKIQLPEM